MGNLFAFPEDHSKEIYEETKYPLYRFLTNTTGHGLGRIPRTRSRSTKTFWFTLWFICFMILCVEGYTLWQKYRHQKPTTMVEMGKEDKIGLPEYYSNAPPLEEKVELAGSPSEHTYVVDEDQTVLGRLKRFADTTTAHGAKRVLVAHSSCSRLIWILTLCFCLCVLMTLVHLLYGKYKMHDRITSISLRSDDVDFPAITFCNLNPYKRSLVRMVPSVRDTMDVYDNAKSSQKRDGTALSRKEQSAEAEKLVRELFRKEIEDEEREMAARLGRGKREIVFDDSFSSLPPTIQVITPPPEMTEEPPTEYLERSERIRRKEPTHQIYEAVEAHCKCIGMPNMECIRFETPPRNNLSKCICRLDMDTNVAWPCFNFTIWYDHMCPYCNIVGECEAYFPPGIEEIPAGMTEESPCQCRNRTGLHEVDEDERPYCLKRHSPVELRKLWSSTPYTTTTTTTTTTTPAPTTTTTKFNLTSTTTTSTTTTTTTTTSTTTPKPRTTTPRSRAGQRAIVSAPETIKAMGFQGMTDGVAMLTRAKENLMFTMAALSEQQRIALSQAKEEFIEMCSFNGKQCDIEKDFRLHVDPEFGNCFTFNYDISNNYTSSRAGPMYGIRILLFVNTSDYMSTSESSGVRLAIHSPLEYPFPDTFGYSAPVGFASSFGIKKQIVQRLPGYGDCVEMELMNETAMNYIYGGYRYHPEGCHRSCFQNHMLKDCSCGDPRFPVPPGVKHCSAFNATARRCLESKIGSTGDFHHMTDCECKHSCKHTLYSMSFSTAKWPSGATDLGDCEGMNEKECEEYYRMNAAMVEVFYEQLNYELLQESEAYGFVNLIADFGGHLGLWMGFSVITIMEVAALIVDIIGTLIRRGTRPSPREDEKQKMHDNGTSRTNAYVQLGCMSCRM